MGIEIVLAITNFDRSWLPVGVRDPSLLWIIGKDKTNTMVTTFVCLHAVATAQQPLK